MAYARSLAVARRELPVLNQLLSGGLVTWDDPAGGVDKFVYRLRQARHIILRNRAAFGKIASIIENYRFEAGETQVRAVPTITEGYTAGGVVTAASPSAPVRALVLDSPQSVEQFIQFWIDKQPTVQPFLITSCSFTNMEMTQLESWGELMDPPWTVSTEEAGTVRVELKRNQG